MDRYAWVDNPLPRPARGPAHEDEVARFLRKKGVNRCPTACVLPTVDPNISSEDRDALAAYFAAQNHSADAKNAQRVPAKGRLKKQREDAHVAEMLPLVAELRRSNPGISNAAIATEMNTRGIATLNGEPWNSAMVNWLMCHERANQ